MSTRLRPRGGDKKAPLYRHATLLVLYMAPVAYLAEQLANPIDYLIETLKVPTALGGVVIAILVATPEALGAIRAAFANRLQRSVNIFLGSVLATIGLSVPFMLAISYFTGHTCRPRPRPRQRPAVAAHAGRQRRHLRQRPHQHPAGRGACDAVRRLPDADVPGVTPWRCVSSKSSCPSAISTRSCA